MHRLRILLLPVLAAVLAAAAGPAVSAGHDIVVVGHPSVPKLDLSSLQRLYTGRVVEVDGRNITVVNGLPGSTARQRFLEQVLQQDDDKYRAYWTVRRHVGKGAPPRELRDAAEVLAYVQATPGAVGYVMANELRPGALVVVWP
jgi:ABC-type phosphate transport system substrate-binding protein